MFCLIVREDHRKRMFDKVLRRRGAVVRATFNSQMCFIPGKCVIKNCLNFLTRYYQYCAANDFKFALCTWIIISAKYYLSL